MKSSTKSAPGERAPMGADVGDPRSLPPFVQRHIGPDDDEVLAMLQTLGFDSLAKFMHEVVPPEVSDPHRLDLGLTPPPDEPRERTRLHEFAARNARRISLIGMGYHGTFTPEVLRRNVLENPSWYTAYTPYQAEVSQGRMEALLNFQQMIMDLTGMEIANASLLDEATAAAEAMTMARRVGKNPSDRFLVDADCHPQTIDVVRTRAAPLGIEVEVRPAAELEVPCFGMLVQYPGSSGALPDLEATIKRAHADGSLVVVAADLLALVLLRSPGSYGADIVVGSSQRFGVPMACGGPHAAFFATRSEWQRSTPGRIIGVSIDRHGQPALRMALQTREQHIRREKATSNICTAQVLLAVMSGLYAVWHGPEGLVRIARQTHRMALALREGFVRLGCEVENETFFDTLTVKVQPSMEEGGARAAANVIRSRLRAAGIDFREVAIDRFGFSVDETTTMEIVVQVLRAFVAPLGREELTGLDARMVNEFADAAAPALPDALLRTDEVLTHPVFHRYRSETEMMRYLRRLAARDIALDRSMIALGSCTMKLNAAIEMIAVTFPELANVHPFAPAEYLKGYHALIGELEQMLCTCTGFEAVSFQPNAGSQGEYAGLLVIRRYHESRGEGARDVCLIPASAHGTNPASAIMAGLRVVVVKCDAEGNVDMDDLRAKATEAGKQLAALMVTFPSTHGVFETSMREMCDIVHGHGGQVYMDGANLNALLGVARPAMLGADVSHINLHKTFCIPHGGGGPGMGPIGVRAHLAPFLPGHSVVAGTNPHAEGDSAIGAVSAAPWGSAGILPISWAYMRLMGGVGLSQATRIAILSANYIAARLEPHYPVLYRGQGGFVAHECIIDLRPIRKACGVSVEDVAKRLIDYGFHAPTMSFPVENTLMIEPTESESKAELDRFCDAMISIRGELRALEEAAERGEEIADDANVLHNAPHTLALAGEDEWPYAYSREQAFFPAPWSREDKYWPPVGRVDNAYGDRNLVCACPPMEAYLPEAAD